MAWMAARGSWGKIPANLLRWALEVIHDTAGRTFRIAGAPRYFTITGIVLSAPRAVRRTPTTPSCTLAGAVNSMVPRLPADTG